MPRSSSHDAIILRTVNVGEADRFCIILSREAGRITAMARGVRKPKSRMGGLILPFKRLTLQLSESSSGATVSSASDPHPDADVTMQPSDFLRLQQGIELLLQLTEEGEPMPQVFSAADQFIRLPDDDRLLPAFQMRLLSLLGFLPSTKDDARYARLPDSAKAYVEACQKIADLGTLRDIFPQSDALSAFVRSVLVEHLNRPLKSESVVL